MIDDQLFMDLQEEYDLNPQESDELRMFLDSMNPNLDEDNLRHILVTVIEQFILET